MSNLPLGWHWATLGAVSEKPQYGWTTKAIHETGRLKLLRTTDITSGMIDWSTVPYCTDEPDDIEKYLIKSGDILISRAGSIGVSFLINKPERAVFASYLIRFRIRNSYNKKYVYYYLKSPDYWKAIGASKVGIAVPNVNATKLAQVPISIAPDAVQKLIVSEIEKQFSRLDEAVAALKRIKANLKHYKAAVLKAAVEGKLTEEWRLSARKRAQVDELESIPKAQTGKWFVYIIECDNQTFYVGHISDLHARWQAHCDGKAADWTHQHPPKYLIHFEVFNSKEAAVKRENDLKTGFGRTWRKREIAVGRMKPLLHNPNNETALPVHEVLTGEKLLKRILAERKKKWEVEHPGKKYKEPSAPDTSNLPELPEGWVWATVEQLATKVQYGTSAKTNEKKDGVPVIRMGNIYEGSLNLDELKYLPINHTEFPELLLKKGDLLFNRTNSPELVGKTAVYMSNPKRCSFASYLIRVQLCDGVNPGFVSSYINSIFGRHWIKTVVSQQVGQANVNGTKLQALSIPLPPDKEQQKIVEEVESRLSVAEEIEETIDINLKRAERLRQAILKKAFSGGLVEHDELTSQEEAIQN